MSRVKRGVTTKKRHNKILKMAKGFYSRSKSCYRIALQQVKRSLQYAYRDRKTRKRDMRCLWIQKIKAACEQRGVKYSVFMHGLSSADTCIAEMNRKTLADIAVNMPDVFDSIVAESSQHLKNKQNLVNEH